LHQNDFVFSLKFSIQHVFNFYKATERIGRQLSNIGILNLFFHSKVVVGIALLFLCPSTFPFYFSVTNMNWNLLMDFNWALLFPLSSKNRVLLPKKSDGYQRFHFTMKFVRKLIQTSSH